MRKIVMIGGGSLNWTPGLVNDLALTESLQDAELVLQDIDGEALKRMTLLCKRIIAQQGSTLKVSATLDREAALRGADFVILCVAIGGLEAMRNDLEIPRRFGVYQSVGDTVGPGGWARALRHIPFAVQVAREMEELCPQAWLLNLTNPMTTICRAVTSATDIRAIGLCHEVAGVRRHLAALFDVHPEGVQLRVAGINHLPVILGFRIGDQDGFAALRAWLHERDAFEFVEDAELVSPFEVFIDRLAVKLYLFEQLGVLFGAGDRHVAEFFPGFLSQANQLGRRFGVHLTTVEHRLAMQTQRVEELPTYKPANGVSDEQLAPLIAALLGGPTGEFVVNIPNQGQIRNLPDDVVVECQAYIDRSGLRPLAVGSLPPPAHAALAAHVDRQEMVVAAALRGRNDLARAALATDPLVHDPQIVPPLFDALAQANQGALAKLGDHAGPSTSQQLIDELAEINARPAQTEVMYLEGSRPGLSVDTTTIDELLAHRSTREILEAHFPGMIDNPQLKMAGGMTLKQIAPFAPNILTAEKLQQVDVALGEIQPPQG